MWEKEFLDKTANPAGKDCFDSDEEDRQNDDDDEEDELERQERQDDDENDVQSDDMRGGQCRK